MALQGSKTMQNSAMSSNSPCQMSLFLVLQLPLRMCVCVCAPAPCACPSCLSRSFYTTNTTKYVFPKVPTSVGRNVPRADRYSLLCYCLRTSRPRPGPASINNNRRSSVPALGTYRSSTSTSTYLARLSFSLSLSQSLSFLLHSPVLCFPTHPCSAQSPSLQRFPPPRVPIRSRPQSPSPSPSHHPKSC